MHFLVPKKVSYAVLPLLGYSDLAFVVLQDPVEIRLFHNKAVCGLRSLGLKLCVFPCLQNVDYA